MTEPIGQATKLGLRFETDESLVEGPNWATRAKIEPVGRANELGLRFGTDKSLVRGSLGGALKCTCGSVRACSSARVEHGNVGPGGKLPVTSGFRWEISCHERLLAGDFLS